ncbi:phthiocerol/phthiodiolone dimycocerosyl transferase family protein, partial [Nocardia brasiliensis]|uniref:phthiocerol/phthiodiolone dimycocerosyl transferase family protein n=1 Tax=Nocardia brasiliensis TaxID=37326 RepID=UPI002453BD81
MYRPDNGALELVDIARSINARLAADLADRAVHRRAGEFAGLGLIRELQRARASALGTNWGRVPTLRHPPILTLTDFRPMFQYNPVVGVAPAESGLPLNFVITSFDGRLSVDLMLPSEPDDPPPPAGGATRAARTEPLNSDWAGRNNKKNRPPQPR